MTLPSPPRGDFTSRDQRRLPGRAAGARAVTGGHASCAGTLRPLVSFLLHPPSAVPEPALRSQDGTQTSPQRRGQPAPSVGCLVPEGAAGLRDPGLLSASGHRPASPRRRSHRHAGRRRPAGIRSHLSLLPGAWVASRVGVVLQHSGRGLLFLVAFPTAPTQTPGRPSGALGQGVLNAAGSFRLGAGPRPAPWRG